MNNDTTSESFFRVVIKVRAAYFKKLHRGVGLLNFITCRQLMSEVIPLLTSIIDFKVYTSTRVALLLTYNIVVC